MNDREADPVASPGPRAADVARAVRQAAARLEGRVRRTPLHRVDHRGEEIWKLENWQLTGSFKLRGALHRMLMLDDREVRAGVIAASSGNHGAAVAHAARQLGSAATVFVPAGADASKLAAIRARGARVITAGEDCVESEVLARAHACERGLCYLSPYNDLAVIAGQGTIAVELLGQLDGFDAVLCAAGGGGLVAGIGSYLQAHAPDVEVVACSPENSPVLHESLREGRIVKMDCKETLSDATAGGMEAGAITLPLCQEVVRRSILVTEAEITAALRDCIDRHHLWIEGAAAVALAAYRKEREHFAGRRTVIVLCGANMGLETLNRLR